MVVSEFSSVWSNVIRKLESKLDKGIFNNYVLNNAELYSFNNTGAVITTKTATAKEILKTQISHINDAFTETTSLDIHCSIMCINELSNSKEIKIDSMRPYIDNSKTFDNFVVGESNKNAYMSSLQIAKNELSMSPLFIYGNTGIGKTHLLQAIGNYVRFYQTTPSNVLYLTASELTSSFTRAALTKNFDEIDRMFHNVDVLLIDDIQYLSLKDKTCEYLFNVFNNAIRNKTRIVLTADKKPTEIKGIEDRLISRFKQGLTVQINAPHTDTTKEIVKKMYEERKISLKIDDEVFSYIAEHSKSVRDLEGPLNKLIFHATTFGLNEEQKIDLNLAKELLGDVIDTKKNALTTDKIIEEVEINYNLTPGSLISKTRNSRIVNARHIAIYLVRKLLGLSYPAIGNEFNRDHSTILASYNKIESLLEFDANYKNVVKKLEKTLLNK